LRGLFDDGYSSSTGMPADAYRANCCSNHASQDHRPRAPSHAMTSSACLPAVPCSLPRCRDPHSAGPRAAIRTSAIGPSTTTAATSPRSKSPTSSSRTSARSSATSADPTAIAVTRRRPSKTRSREWLSGRSHARRQQADRHAAPSRCCRFHTGSRRPGRDTGGSAFLTATLDGCGQQAGHPVAPNGSSDATPNALCLAIRHQ
jgi:hypothetical protein